MGVSVGPWQLIVLIFSITGFFTPSIVAFVRYHNRKWLVLVLNDLTGWTGIGWVAALAWAFIGKSIAFERSPSEVFK